MMPRQKVVVPRIMARLAPYLDARMTAWRVLPEPEEKRAPTLPFTSDYKVNAHAVAEAIGLPADVQHFWKQDEIKEAINAAADAQGLGKLGSRADSGAIYEAANDPKMRRLERRVSELERQNASLRAECMALRQKLKRLSHMEIHLIETGRMPR